MTPALEDGDYAVARILRGGQALAVGDIVEVDHPDFGRMVKRVKEARPDCIWLDGLAMRSVDSDQIGPTPRKRVLARLVWRISPQGLSRVGARSRG